MTFPRFKFVFLGTLIGVLASGVAAHADYNDDTPGAVVTCTGVSNSGTTFPVSINAPRTALKVGNEIFTHIVFDTDGDTYRSYTGISALPSAARRTASLIFVEDKTVLKYNNGRFNLYHCVAQKAVRRY